MSAFAPLSLLAVHISDGVLAPSWEWGGLALAALLACVGAWRLRDDELPRVALLTAAFFVASQMHIRVPGAPATTHLLLNGLVGVVLGRRALIAIPIGLFLQKVLFEHGGYLALGVNAVVLGVPALGAWALFGGLRCLPGLTRPRPRGVLVALSALTFLLTLVYAVALLTNDTDTAVRTVARPLTWVVAVVVSLAAAWAERRLENAPEFPLGLVVGEATVLLTVLLNALALAFGGQADWHRLALIGFLIQIPLAVLEGVLLGFTVGFVARVKPEMLGWRPAEKVPCPAESPS